MGSSLSKRKASEDIEEDRVVVKRARLEYWRTENVVITVGSMQFEESDRFLKFHSGFFGDELNSKPELEGFEFPDKDPEEWKLLKAVFNPFARDKINKNNYAILLPWFSEFRCEDALEETDRVVLTTIVEPLLAKEESERTPKDVNEIVTVLEHCVTWNRSAPRDRCILFLEQVLQDPGQPFAEEAILRIVLLLVKDDACQKALWQMIKHYMPAASVEDASFPKDQVMMVLDNPMLMDVIVANKKLKKYLYVIELKLKNVVASQQGASKKADEKEAASESDSQETSLGLNDVGDEAEMRKGDIEGVPVEISLIN